MFTKQSCCYCSRKRLKDSSKGSQGTYVGWNLNTAIKVGTTLHVDIQASEEQNKIFKAYLVATLMPFPLPPIVRLPHCILPLQSGKQNDGGRVQAFKLAPKLCLILLTPYPAFSDGLQKSVCCLRKLGISDTKVYPHQKYFYAFLSPKGCHYQV